MYSFPVYKILILPVKIERIITSVLGLQIKHLMPRLYGMALVDLEGLWGSAPEQGQNMTIKLLGCHDGLRNTCRKTIQYKPLCSAFPIIQVLFFFFFFSIPYFIVESKYCEQAIAYVWFLQYLATGLKRCPRWCSNNTLLSEIVINHSVVCRRKTNTSSDNYGLRKGIWPERAFSMATHFFRHLKNVKYI